MGGRTSGSFLISYDMFKIPDRIKVSYQGKKLYDTVFVVSGCRSGIKISYGPGTSTRVDFLVTSNDKNTEWKVATGCPSAAGPPDIGCKAPPTTCSQYPTVNKDYAACSCQVVGSISGPCGSNTVFSIPVSGGVCQSSQVV